MKKLFIHAMIPTLALACASYSLAGEASPTFPKTGTASWYGDECRGKPMANGKPFVPEALTVASWHHPLGTKIRVTAENGNTVDVVVTDRGPAKRLVNKGRILDLSEGAFKHLAVPAAGLVKVTNVQVIL